MLDRIVRNTAVSCVVIAALAAAWTRGFRAPLGVLGGGLSDRAFLLGHPGHGGRADRASIGCRAIAAKPRRRRNPCKPSRFPLVKFFTRHGMLALAAYVMMVRLHLDPVGLLAGVSSLAVAVAVEVLRDLRWRRFP